MRYCCISRSNSSKRFWFRREIEAGSLVKYNGGWTNFHVKLFVYLLGNKILSIRRQHSNPAPHRDEESKFCTEQF